MAKRLGYLYIDSGAMYRAVTLFAIQQGIIQGEVLDQGALIAQLDQIQIAFQFDQDTQKARTLLNQQDVESAIRSMKVSQMVSPVAALPEVRKKLVHLQQEIGQNLGVVMDGRDIGTVVYPDAALKVFMTASHEVRVERRYQELLRKGDFVSREEVSENLKRRDEIDSNRKTDPLTQAEDAVVLDNSNLEPDEQLELALSWADERLTALI